MSFIDNAQGSERAGSISSFFAPAQPSSSSGGSAQVCQPPTSPGSILQDNPVPVQLKHAHIMRGSQIGVPAQQGNVAQQGTTAEQQAQGATTSGQRRSAAGDTTPRGKQLCSRFLCALHKSLCNSKHVRSTLLHYLTVPATSPVTCAEAFARACAFGRLLQG